MNRRRHRRPAAGRLGRLVIPGLIIAAFTGSLLMTGCGRKAPPLAPQPNPTPAVDDLRADLENDIVKLSWIHNPQNWGAKSYIVLRAQTDLSKPACPGCPLVFQKVGTVPVAKVLRRTEHNLSFSQPLMTGFTYTFKVRPVFGSGAQGPDSNLIVLDLKE